MGGDDLTVRVVQRSSPSEGAYELPTGRAVKCLAWDPAGRFLAATTIDGCAHVFDLESSDRRLEARMEGCKLADVVQPGESDIEFPAAWHPSGAVLAVASTVGVLVYARNRLGAALYALHSPSAPPTHVHDAYTGTTGLAWSPNGRYLAAADSRRVLTVWDVTEAATDPYTHEYLVSSKAAGAGEPAVAMHGVVRYSSASSDEGEGGGGAGGTGAAGGSVTVERNATIAKPRVTQLAWLPGGEELGVIDTDGSVVVVRLASLTRKGSAAEPLAAQPPWPLLVPVRAAAPAAKKESAGAGAGAGTGAGAAAAVLAAGAPERDRKSVV